MAGHHSNNLSTNIKPAARLAARLRERRDPGLGLQAILMSIFLSLSQAELEPAKLLRAGDG